MTQAAVSKVFAQEAKLGSIADIDSGLDRLWAQFNQDVNVVNTVIMRACMSNLVIYCDTPQEAEVIGQEISVIVDAHPARVILLNESGNTGNGTIEAQIALYYTPQEEGWQVCGERIDITASSAMKERLPYITRSLLIGDLPTTLWWVSQRPPPSTGDLFLQLSELVNQVIYDNVGWVNPVQGVAMMTRWVESEQNSLVVHNLAWRRFTYWRKLIGQVLDPGAAPGALEKLHTIEVKHGPHALASTWLLTGWLANRLGWQATDGKAFSDSALIWRFKKDGREIKFHVHRLPEGEPLIYQILFDWGDKTDANRICFERVDRERIGIVENLSTIPPRLFTAQVPARADLVSAQLAQRNRDKIFEAALKTSQAMTAVFQK